jgi:hypothetical protein
VAMTAAEILVRRVARGVAETAHVNTLNVADRVTIDFVWYPGESAASLASSVIDTFVVDHPVTNAVRTVSYTWTLEGRAALRREMTSGTITISLPVGRRGVLTVFATSWQITRVAAGVNMSPVNQLLGVQQRLNRLGYHLRAAGAPNPGADGVLGGMTERAVSAFQADYRPVAAGPANRLQVRGEWTNNAALNVAQYIAGSANPSAADSANLQQALTAYVGA